MKKGKNCGDTLPTKYRLMACNMPLSYFDDFWHPWTKGMALQSLWRVHLHLKVNKSAAMKVIPNSQAALLRHIDQCIDVADKMSVFFDVDDASCLKSEGTDDRFFGGPCDGGKVISHHRNDWIGLIFLVTLDPGHWLLFTH